MKKSHIDEEFAKSIDVTAGFWRMVVRGDRNLNIGKAKIAAEELGIQAISLVDPDDVEIRKTAWGEYVLSKTGGNDCRENV